MDVLNSDLRRSENPEACVAEQRQGGTSLFMSQISVGLKKAEFAVAFAPA
jgi:hypothetical protein